MYRLPVIVLLLVSCRGGPDSVRPPEGAADLVLKGVRAAHYEDGRLASRVTTDELRLSRKSGRAELSMPTAASGPGAEPLAVTGRRGTLDLRTGMLHLVDGATMRDGRGALVEAATADIDLRSRSSRGADVVVHDDGLTSRADRFTATGGAATKVELRGNVRTTVADTDVRR
jgi:hypothetical protein